MLERYHSIIFLLCVMIEEIFFYLEVKEVISLLKLLIILIFR